MSEHDGCSRCGICCTWIAFRCYHGGAEWEEFYRVRGCQLLKGPNGEPQGLLVPSQCQHLDWEYPEISPGVFSEKKCTCLIYKDRPARCRMPEGQPDGKTFYRHEGCTRP